MKKYLIAYVLFLVILFSGCKTPGNSNKPNGKNLATENKLEKKNPLKCSAKYLEIKENPNVLVQIMDKNYKNNTKKNFTTDEIDKLYFGARMSPPKKGSYLSSQLCAGDKVITLDPLNVKFHQIPKDYKSNVFEQIQFFDQLKLSPGVYQIYAYYSFDGKTWYVDGNKVEFEVTGNQNLSQDSDTLHKDEIYVRAEEGKINSEDKYSYIIESRGEEGKKNKEVYLNTQGANAEYNVVAPTSGLYELSLKLIDDGKPHKDNKKNVTISINGKNIQYIHKSENTNGWKWYPLGEVELKEGENKVVITKDKNTNVAFVMNAFKFTKK